MDMRGFEDMERIRGRIWSLEKAQQKHGERLTVNENGVDAIRHGRGHSKLMECQVIELREKYRYDAAVELAKRYGVSASVIRNALSGKTWQHVDLYP